MALKIAIVVSLSFWSLCAQPAKGSYSQFLHSAVVTMALLQPERFLIWTRYVETDPC